MLHLIQFRNTALKVKKKLKILNPNIWYNQEAMIKLNNKWRDSAKMVAENQIA